MWTNRELCTFLNMFCSYLTRFRVLLSVKSFLPHSYSLTFATCLINNFASAAMCARVRCTSIQKICRECVCMCMCGWMRVCVIYRSEIISTASTSSSSSPLNWFELLAFATVTCVFLLLVSIKKCILWLNFLNFFFSSIFILYWFVV